jgi:hypothetical protein
MRRRESLDAVPTPRTGKARALAHVTRLNRSACI